MACAKLSAAGASASRLYVVIFIISIATNSKGGAAAGPWARRFRADKIVFDGNYPGSAFALSRRPQPAHRPFDLVHWSVLRVALAVYLKGKTPRSTAHWYGVSALPGADPAISVSRSWSGNLRTHHPDQNRPDDVQPPAGPQENARKQNARVGGSGSGVRWACPDKPESAAM